MNSISFARTTIIFSLVFGCASIFVVTQTTFDRDLVQCHPLNGWSKKFCIIKALHEDGLRVFNSSISNVASGNEPAGFLANFETRIYSPCVELFDNVLHWIQPVIFGDEVLIKILRQCHFITSNNEPIHYCFSMLDSGHYDDAKYRPVPREIYDAYDALMKDHSPKNILLLMRLIIGYLCPGQRLDIGMPSPYPSEPDKQGNKVRSREDL